MLAKLFLAFTIIPLLELLVLIPLGQEIGVWPTIAIVVATAATGAWLGKMQGLGAWKRIQGELASGQLPGDSILDGLLILIACTLLITPGVLTDVVGIALLIPPARKPIKKYLKRRFTKQLQNPSFTVIDVSSSRHHEHGPRTDEDIIDVTPEAPREKKSAEVVAQPLVVEEH